MVKRLLVLVTFCAVACAACSGSSAPAPSRAGTWQVTVQSLDTGTLTPSTFTVGITPISESTYSVVMPSLVWSAGPAVYDTIPQMARFQSDTDPASSLAFEEWCKSIRCMLTFWGRMNAARDTVASGGIIFFDTITVNNVLWLQTKATGRFVAHK